MINWWFVYATASIGIFFIISIWYMLFMRFYNMVALTLPKNGVVYDENNTSKRKDYNLLREHYNYVVKQYEILGLEPPKEVAKLRKRLIKTITTEEV